MKRLLRQWFRELVADYVIVNVPPAKVEVHPTPVTVTPAPVDAESIAAIVVAALPVPPPPPEIPAPSVDVDKLMSGVAEQLYAVIDQKLVATVNEALKPRLPEQPLEKQFGNPTTEGKLLSLLPSEVQKAARYGCRHVQSESRFPVGGKTLGHNWHRDEACERAMTWLQERCIQYHSSDVHLACELYYRVYVKRPE